MTADPWSVAPEKAPTLADALAQGLTRFLGLPCGKGHAGWRYVSSHQCVVCTTMRAAESRRRVAQRKRQLLANIKGNAFTHRFTHRADYAANALPARPAGTSPPGADLKLTEPAARRLALCLARLVPFVPPARQCRFIITGDFDIARQLIADGQPERIYCGKASVDGRSFCPEHAARCYAPRAKD